MQWPPVYRAGRAIMTPAPEDVGRDRGRALRQLIALRVQDGASTHPWLQGLAGDVGTWKPTDGRGMAKIRQRINDMFEALDADRRARLASLSMRGEGGTLRISIVYEDLETGNREDLEVPING